MNQYFIYILTNQYKNVLYIGVTNDLKNRLYEHRNNTDKKAFTYRYNCHFLVYFEKFESIEQAIAREKQLKNWSRKKKDTLINNFNPEWKFLNNEID